MDASCSAAEPTESPPYHHHSTKSALSFPNSRRPDLAFGDINPVFPDELPEFQPHLAPEHTPEDFTAPTSIQNLSEYPALSAALGKETVPANKSDEKHVLETSQTRTYERPFGGEVTSQGSGVGGRCEEDPSIERGEEDNQKALGLTDYEVMAVPMGNLGDGNGSGSDMQGETRTGHISENAHATEVMISQGSGIRKAETVFRNSNSVESNQEEAPRHGGFSSENEGSAGLQVEAAPTGRVDVDKLDVIDNPLSKSDRYTVIKGRLPDSDPFMRAAQNLGYVFMSNEMKATVGDMRRQTVSEKERESFFMRDIEAFNKELSRDYKIPIIGGGQLSLYALAMEVMKLGGLKNVVQNRAFRIVGQQLLLPKSCTSAAFVLKTAYEKLIYMYEQKLAFGINPINPLRTIDMKSVVSEKKRKEDDRRGGRVHRRQNPAGTPQRIFTPLAELQGRITKRSVLESARSKQVKAIRDTSNRELQFSAAGRDEAGVFDSEGCSDLAMYRGMSVTVEKLTPRQPKAGSSGFEESTPSELAIPMQNWAAEAANSLFDPASVNSMLEQRSSCSEEQKMPGSIVIPPGFFSNPILGHSYLDIQLPTKFTTEQAVYAVFGGNDAVKALQMSAKILHALRETKSPVKLSEMKNGAGGTLLSSIVQGLTNYLETIRVSADGGWRAVIARCAGEMLRILLLVQENQIFVALSKRLWSVSAQLLSTDVADEPVANSLWTAMSIMAPYLPASIEPEAVVELLQLASEHLKNTSESAVQVAWFISGSIRGLNSKMPAEQDALIASIFTTLAAYVNTETGPEALRHATLTALLHLSRVYPEMGAQIRGLVYALIKQLTEPLSGGLAASTLYYISQARPDILSGFEDLLHAQTNRVVSSKSGSQTEQVVSILALLCASEK